MIENTCLVQSFPHRNDNVKRNNRHENFRKNQDTINLCVMSNDDESSNNNNNDAVMRTLLKKISMHTHDSLKTRTVEVCAKTNFWRLRGGK